MLIFLSHAVIRFLKSSVCCSSRLTFCAALSRFRCSLLCWRRSFLVSDAKERASATFIKIPGTNNPRPSTTFRDRGERFAVPPCFNLANKNAVTGVFERDSQCSGCPTHFGSFLRLPSVRLVAVSLLGGVPSFSSRQSSERRPTNACIQLHEMISRANPCVNPSLISYDIS